MVGCVLSQLKPSEIYILAVEKASASAFSTAKNVELLGLYPIHNHAVLSRDVPLRLWMLYSFYPKKSTFFNMTVTESDLDSKVRKMSIILL